MYLNGKKLGTHEGGFTPFSFEITDIVREKDNFLVVKADNTRKKEAVPTTNTDWWNYGAIMTQFNQIHKKHQILFLNLVSCCIECFA